MCFLKLLPWKLRFWDSMRSKSLGATTRMPRKSRTGSKRPSTFSVRFQLLAASPETASFARKRESSKTEFSKRPDHRSLGSGSCRSQCCTPRTAPLCTAEGLHDGVSNDAGAVDVLLLLPGPQQLPSLTCTSKLDESPPDTCNASLSQNRLNS